MPETRRIGIDQPIKDTRSFLNRAPPVLNAARSQLTLSAMEVVDVAIVGAGPAGSVCAAFCAAAGLRVALIEREKFPREKVCGDCINPACLPVWQELGLRDQIQGLPHAIANAVDFVTIGGRTVRANF